MPAWSPDQRDQAIALVAEVGLSAASRRTGIPKPTLCRWTGGTTAGTFHRAQTANAIETHKLNAAERREALKLGLLRRAEVELQRLGAPATVHKLAASGREITVHLAEPEPTDRRAIATTLAILLDKHLLLDGQATSRIETIAPETAEAIDNVVQMRRAS